MIFIFWIYLTWLIILAGSMVCSQLQYRSFSYYRSLNELNYLQVRLVTILILFRICKAYFNAQKPVTMADLVEYSQLALPDVYKILESLENEKLIIKARKKDRQVILPGSKINALTLGELLHTMDFPDEFAAPLPVVNNSEQEMKILDLWYNDQQNGKRTLTDIFVARDDVGNEKFIPTSTDEPRLIDKEG